MARALDIPPSEFWAMTFPELLLEFNLRKPKKAKGLSAADIDMFKDWMEEEDGRPRG